MNRDEQLIYIAGAALGGASAVLGTVMSVHPTIGAVIGLAGFLCLTPLGFVVSRKLIR